MAQRTIRNIALTACALLVLLSVTAVPAEAQSDKMQLNVRDASVEEVLKLVAEAGDFNIAIGDGIKGNVTLFVDNIAPRDLLDVVVGLIDAAYVREKGSVWVMTKQRYEERYGEPFVDATRSRTFVLKEAKVADVVTSIRELAGNKAVVRPNQARNMVWVKASPRLMQDISEMINAMDLAVVTEGYQLYSTPVSVAGEFLTKLMPEGVNIAEDNINQRLLVSASQFDHNRIKDILGILDVGEGIQSAVLDVHYADPDSLASQLLPHLTPDVGQVFAERRAHKLVVVDFPSKVNKVTDLVTKLDVPRRQVLLEAKIIQVAFTNTLQTGINWTYLQDKVNVEGFFPSLTNTDPGVRGEIVSGDFEVLAEALQTFGETNLLSSPRLVVTDGGTGSIHVGSQVPYKTIDTRESQGVISNFEKVVIIDVGVKLEVTATIHGDDMISMTVIPEVSSVSGYSENIPIVEASTANSTLTVQDGNTIILGGLIRQEERKVRKGVPLLSSIPLIKYVFSSTDNEKINAELIILLTPRIMTGRETYEGELSINE
jgi:general secretion pathway protein D